MGPKRHPKNTLSSKAEPSAPAPGPTPIAKIVSGIVAGLPLLERKAVEEAVAEAKERPRASLQFLFDRFTSGEPAMRAVVARLIAEIGGADVLDNLNAVIFDIGQDAFTKVLANDLLAQLGSPVDPDVLAMSVPNAEELRRKLPSRALQLLEEGNVAGAVEHVRALHQAERWMIMHAAAARQKERALPLLEVLAADDEANATAAASAIGAQRLAAGARLLLQLQRSGGRELQKLVKRLLFELRKAGVEIPDEKPKAPAAPAAEAADDKLPLYRAMMSDPSPNGLVLVTIARARPNGRLKAFSVLVDFWKRGIQQAGLRLEMSKSSFDRFVESQGGSRLRMMDRSIQECRRTVARGMRVAKELGSPLPFDFGVGKALLGDVEKDAAAIENPFLCSGCGAALEPEAVQKIRTVAPYEQILPETRCVNCRPKP